jgi:hypothetical protein
VEYEPDFAKSFMRRTLDIARTYNGPYDATLLINCMLGLLVVPKEALIDKIPAAPFESLAEWGIKPGSIRSAGKCEYGHEHSPTLRQLVRRMRNAVAHFKIEPFPSRGEVQGFSFKDRNGFDARITLPELHDLVVKLAAHLENAA